MPEEKAVETVEAAPQEVTGTQASSDIDYAAEYAKMREERDNYKKGMLIAKGKLKAKAEEIDEEDTDIQSIVARTVQAELAAARHEDLNKREESLVQKLIRENKELKLATQNRSQVSPTGMGGKSADTEPEVKTTYWSQEQLAEFKKRGIDPNKVIENLKR